VCALAHRVCPPSPSLSSTRRLHGWVSGFESGTSLLATGLVQVFPCISPASRVSIRGRGLRRLSIRTASDREHRERSNHSERERCFHPLPLPRWPEMTNGSSDQRSEFSLSITRPPSALRPPSSDLCSPSPNRLPSCACLQISTLDFLILTFPAFRSASRSER
jgi:hypothetical protein